MSARTGLKARPGLLALSVVMGVTALLVDVDSPASMTAGVLYLAPVLLSLWAPRRHDVVLATGCTSLLVLVGALLATPTDRPTVVIFNRLLALAALWGAAGAVWLYKRTEERLLKERGERQAFLDVAESLIVVLDLEGRVAYANRKCRETLGAAPAELIGSDWFERVPEPDRAGRRTAIASLLRGDPARPEGVSHPVVTAGGDERTISWHDTLLRDPAGRVTGALSSGQDVTDQVRTEQALDRSLQRLRDISHALDKSSIVAMTDARGRITYANDTFCAISKYAREELLGQDHRLLNSGHHPKEFFKELWRTIGGGAVWKGDIKNHAKDGSVYWVGTTIVPFLDDAGKPYQYMAIRNDITARKEAEEQVIRNATLAALGEMAAVVAHEVRNPLAGIGGALQVIRGRMPADAEERSVIADILTRIDSLAEMISDLLLLARPKQPEPTSFRLDELLAEGVRLVREDPRFPGLDLRLEAEPLRVHADPKLLKGVMVNLLLNAAQAVDGRGSVIVRCTSTRDRCRVEVRDDGPGVAPEHRARLFEPFFTTKHRGTGLGLAIARRVVTDHHGRMGLDCPPAGGTIAWLELPLAPG